MWIKHGLIQSILPLELQLPVEMHFCEEAFRVLIQTESSWNLLDSSCNVLDLHPPFTSITLHIAFDLRFRMVVSHQTKTQNQRQQQLQKGQKKNLCHRNHNDAKRHFGKNCPTSNWSHAIRPPVRFMIYHISFEHLVINRKKTPNADQNIRSPITNDADWGESKVLNRHATSCNFLYQLQ